MMSNVSRLAGAILSAGMMFVATQAMGQDQNAEARSAAKMLAGLERPLEKRDIKGYCTALQADPDYVGYVTRVCQFSVKNKLKKPEDCSDANIKQEMKKDFDVCLAMPSEEFEKTVLKWREAQASFVRDMKAKGIDGEKLLQEERAKLR